MRTLVSLIFLSAFLLSFTSSAQSIDPASEWRVNFSYWDPGHEIHEEFYRDFIDGDTTINAITYAKVYKSGYTRIEWIPNPANYYYSHVLHGLIREENHKWYIYDLGEQTDKLLFDFTLGVNDTVHSACTHANQQPILVTSVDSVPVDNHYKKRFHLNIPFGAENYIEDIGAASGLFENMVYFEWDSQMICFAKNGISVWGAATDSCDLNVAIGEKKDFSREIAVYPNPARDYAYVPIPAGFGSYCVMLIDPYGRIRSEVTSAAGSLVKLSLASCPGGLYFVRIDNERGSRVIKLLIQ
jgi:hypothetical protein